MVDTSLPIFIQIKEKIKDDILSGIYSAHELIISTTQIAKLYCVNPTTAVKAVSMLTDEGLIYKKRGIGMCVAETAREQILRERTGDFYQNILVKTINEAKKIGLSKSNLIKLIEESENYD